MAEFCSLITSVVKSSVSRDASILIASGAVYWMENIFHIPTNYAMFAAISTWDFLYRSASRASSNNTFQFCQNGCRQDLIFNYIHVTQQTSADTYHYMEHPSHNKHVETISKTGKNMHAHAHAHKTRNF